MVSLRYPRIQYSPMVTVPAITVPVTFKCLMLSNFHLFTITMSQSILWLGIASFLYTEVTFTILLLLPYIPVKL